MPAPRMLLRAAKVTAPLAAHTRPGHLRPAEAGGGEQEACWLCVCWGRGQPVPWPAVPLKHFISALARSVGEGSSCSEMGAGAALCPCALPAHDIRRAKLLPGPLERGGFGAAEPRSSFALSAAVLARLCLRTLSLLLLSPLERETGRAQLCCVSWKFRLQLHKCPAVLHPPGTPAFTLNANCSLNVSVGGF